MGNIMGAKGQVLSQNLIFQGRSDFRGLINIRAEALKESNETVFFQFEWTNVTNTTPGCMGMCPETHGVIYYISRSSGG
jgi:hypothetical protein